MPAHPLQEQEHQRMPEQVSRTWVRNNDKTKTRAEEREKNIGWIGRLFTAWRVSRAARKESGEDKFDDDETVVIPSSAVTINPKGTPVLTPTIEVQVLGSKREWM